MQREPVLYEVRRKNPQLAEALIRGFRARAVPIEGARLQPDALHIICGLQYGALDLLSEARLLGEPYVFVDRAYFGGGPGSGVYRVVPGAYQHHWIGQPDMARLAALGVQLRPWQTGGEEIMVVPPSAAVADLFGLVRWEQETVERLESCAGSRPIFVSTKGDPLPLAERLRRCHAVVTWSSNTATEALIAGVPAITGPYAAAAPVAGALKDLERIIASPPRIARETWAAALAAGQFTLAEIADGTAAACVTPQMKAAA